MKVINSSQESRDTQKKEKQKDENYSKPVGEISFVVALFFDLNERDFSNQFLHEK